MTLPFIPEGTKQSRLLCEEISKRSDGICILSFSRGKDSLTAWIWLKQFFHTIHVYHMSPVPGLRCMENSLKFYERKFESTVNRFVESECLEGIKGKVFQTLDRYELIDGLTKIPKGYHHYSVIADILRRKYDCPNAWHAHSMLMNDNIFRRMNLKKLDSNGELTYSGAMFEDGKTFYPIFDWSREQLIEALTKNEVWLPDDYKIQKRSLASYPNPASIEAWMEYYPEDIAEVELYFPLIRSVWARMQFRRMKEVGNGVVKKTVREVLRELKLQRLERELENAERIPDKRKSRK